MRVARILFSFAAGGVLTFSFPAIVHAAETITYTYDSLGRVVVVKSTGTVNNNQTHSYCYDKAGNRIQYNAGQTGVPAACVTTG